MIGICPAQLGLADARKICERDNLGGRRDQGREIERGKHRLLVIVRVGSYL